MAAGTDDPGGSSPSELCTGYITLKCSDNGERVCDRLVFDNVLGSEYAIRISIFYKKLRVV